MGGGSQRGRVQFEFNHLWPKLHKMIRQRWQPIGAGKRHNSKNNHRCFYLKAGPLFFFSTRLPPGILLPPRCLVTAPPFLFLGATLRRAFYLAAHLCTRRRVSRVIISPYSLPAPYRGRPSRRRNYAASEGQDGGVSARRPRLRCNYFCAFICNRLCIRARRPL